MVNLVAGRRSPHKTVCEYLAASPVREQAAEDPCLLRWQGGGNKIAGLMFSCQAADQFPSGPDSFPVPVVRRRSNFSPIRAEGMDGLGTAFKGMIRKFLKVLAVHLQGLYCN
jgi:hypothetical protein